ncbi:dynactin subunit 3 [Euwallacea fornicatus]|uniref:dynactin subunit 3 n=1 Tax=Euwallacea fornicatus TaxID=995702 RepID=UPI00338D771D
MESIDLLEKRIEALELQILPKDKSSIDGTSPAITDVLLHTQTMISSALSCRDAITSILQNMTTINDYLDPCNGENDLEVEAKRHYLLELYPELKDTVQLIRTFQNLMPFTNSENILKVTELSDKLQQLTADNLTIYEESREVTKNVLKSLQQYSDITRSISVLFIQLDRTVTDLEAALQPRFVTEE